MISFFFMLCVSVSGGDENCDYSWDVIFNADDWASLHKLYNVGGEPDTTNGFTDPNEKRVFILYHPLMNEVLSHETQHVECYVQSKNLIELNPCNQKIDTRDIMKQSTHDIHKTPEPPKITAKMTDAIYGRVIIS